MRKLPYLFFAICACISTPGPARTEPVTLPPYAEVRGLDRYATEAEFAEAAADKRFVFEKIAYPSDGLTVFAYVYRPAATEKPRPVIIFNRGSFTWPSFASEMLVMAHRFASAGYVVVAPMYRGSGGAAGRDEMGGADLNDLFALLPVIKAMPAADFNRLYLFGESRGGMMVYQALRDGFPAKAAATVGAFTDLDDMVKNPNMAKFVPQIWPEFDKDRQAIVTRRSALQWADKIKTPVLIMHGESDPAVPVAESLALATKLSTMGGDFELRVVNNGDQTLDGLGGQRELWVIDWFAKH